MENKLPILSINIPTYNRPLQIQQQVRRILPQLSDEIVLNVFDNHSQQSVESLFTSEEKRHFNIVRHRYNIGGDANIARCFEECNTKWLWTLSDDDFVLPNAVNTILKYIKDNEDCVFINFWSNKPGLTTSYKEFALKLSDQSMFSAAFAMSTCLYNWDVLQADLSIYYKYLSSKLGTLIMVAHNVKRTQSSCYFINNCVVELGADVGWNYGTYIYFSSLITDALKYTIEDRKLLVGYYKTNYALIEYNRKSSNIGYFNRIQLFIKVTMLQGLIRALYYCPKSWTRSLISTLLGDTGTYFVSRIIKSCFKFIRS